MQQQALMTNGHAASLSLVPAIWQTVSLGGEEDVFALLVSHRPRGLAIGHRVKSFFEKSEAARRAKEAKDAEVAQALGKVEEAKPVEEEHRSGQATLVAPSFVELGIVSPVRMELAYAKGLGYPWLGHCSFEMAIRACYAWDWTGYTGGAVAFATEILGTEACPMLLVVEKMGREDEMPELILDLSSPHLLRPLDTRLVFQQVTNA